MLLVVLTNDIGHTADRKWTSAPAELKTAKNLTTVRASLPPGATAWFFNLDAGGLVLSSDLATAGPQE